MKGKSFWRQGEDKFLWTCRARSYNVECLASCFQACHWPPGLGGPAWQISADLLRLIRDTMSFFQETSLWASHWDSPGAPLFSAHSTVYYLSVLLGCPLLEKREDNLSFTVIPFFACIQKVLYNILWINESWRDATVSAKNLDRVDRIAAL